MSTSQEIKRQFFQLPSKVQTGLLEELLQEHELKGTVLLSAKEDVLAKRKKKPCHIVRAKMFINEVNKVVFVCILVRNVRNGTAKRRGPPYMT